MPWTTGDVDRFKSGLTQSQKQRWVRIANSALRSCQQRGGSNCEASAIRQANGVVGNEKTNNMEHLKIQTNTDYQIRQETFNGKSHLVVPVIMMVEGVHNGSHGPLYHPISELGRYPGAWNGTPVVVNHPQVDGTSVSANDPNVLEAENVGTIFNTQVDQQKLKAEAWIDEQRLLAVSPDTCERIKRGEKIEVSVGVFNDEEQTQGTWNNEQYAAIARNHRPDHLALLPDAEGACSIDDGCGIGANKKGGNNEMSKKNGEVETQKLEFVTNLLTNQDVDYKELVYDLQRKLDGWDNNDKAHYLQAVYDDHIIYQVRRSNDGSEEFYKQTYEVNEEEGTIEFMERPQKVQKRVEFITTQKKSVFTNLKQFLTMTKKANQPCCPEKVDQLIANKATRWEETDKEALNQLDEGTIDKMFPVEVKEDPTGNKKEEGKEDPKKKEDPTNNTEGGEKPKISQEDLQEALKDYAKDTDAFLKLAPQEVADHMREGVRLNKQKRADLIKGITENSSFSEDDVKDESTEKLEKLYNAVAPADYSGMAGGKAPSANSQDDEVPPLLSPQEEKARQKQTEKEE